MTAFIFLYFLCSLSLLLLGTRAQVETLPTNITSGFVRFANTTRQITWFYSPNDLVIYDGDIIFGTIVEFNDALVNITYSSDPHSSLSRRNNTSKALAKRAFSDFPGSPSIWPGGNVYYRYWDDNTESQLSQYVNEAIAIWSAAVPCIRFVPLANDDNPGGAHGIVTIRAHNPNVGYCLASGAYSSTSAVWMDLDTGGGCGTPEVLHEIGA